jgi:hypothetical protein
VRWVLTVQRYAQWGIVLLVFLLILPGGPLQWLFSLAQPFTRALLGT